MRVVQAGSMTFDSHGARFDGWVIDAEGAVFRDIQDAQRQGRATVLAYVANRCGVTLDMEMAWMDDPVQALAAERVAMQVIENARAETAPRPWWRFWR